MQEKALETRATPQSNADTWAMVDEEGEQGTPRAVLQRSILQTSSPLTGCCTAPHGAERAQVVLQPGSSAARCPSSIPPHKRGYHEAPRGFHLAGGELLSSAPYRSASFPFTHQRGGRKRQSRSLGIWGMAMSVGIQLLFMGS